MTAMLVAEFVVGIVGTVVFLVGFGTPWRADDHIMRWHIASFSAATGAEFLLLLLLVLHVPLPVWVFVILYGVIDAVIIWRLALLLAARRRDPTDRR